MFSIGAQILAASSSSDRGALTADCFKVIQGSESSILLVFDGGLSRSVLQSAIL